MMAEVRTRQAILDEIRQFIEGNNEWRFLVEHIDVFRLVFRYNLQTGTWQVRFVNGHVLHGRQSPIPIRLSEAEMVQFRPTQYSEEEAS